MDKHVGLVGKIGPAFKNGINSQGSIEVTDGYSDNSSLVNVPGDYFALPKNECLRASFDQLIDCENN